MPKISDRLKYFTESVIRDMTRVAIQYNAINLSQGFPDFDPPVELVDAAKRLAEQYAGRPKPGHQWFVAAGCRPVAIQPMEICLLETLQVSG